MIFFFSLNLSSFNSTFIKQKSFQFGIWNWLKDFECVLIKIDYVFLQSILNEFSSKVHNCKYLLNLTKFHELIQLKLA